MKVHRIRKAKKLYDKENYHIFLEVEKNRWLEIDSLDGVTYDSIQFFLKCEKKLGSEWWVSPTKIFSGEPSRIGIIRGSLKT